MFGTNSIRQLHSSHTNTPPIPEETRQRETQRNPYFSHFSFSPSLRSDGFPSRSSCRWHHQESNPSRLQGSIYFSSLCFLQPLRIFLPTASFCFYSLSLDFPENQTGVKITFSFLLPKFVTLCFECRRFRKLYFPWRTGRFSPTYWSS